MAGNKDNSFKSDSEAEQADATNKPIDAAKAERRASLKQSVNIGK